MYKRYIYFILLAIMDWMHVGAQTQPALHTGKQDTVRIIKDTVPEWVRKIKLFPNEWLEFQPGKQVDYVLYGPLLNFQSAVPKSVLIEKSDSILKASHVFGKLIAKRLRLNKRSVGLTLSALYFDRACGNAGLSRKIIYTIKGRKCKMYSDSSFDDSYRLDSAISSRLHLFSLQPNQFFCYYRAKNAIVLDNITSDCVKDYRYINESNLTPATKVISRVLFEVVQRSFPQFVYVGCACTAPHGEYNVNTTVQILNQEKLRNKYDTLYKDYREGRWP